MARRTVNSCKGFTLFEVVVILAVLAVLAALIAPMALRIFQVAAEDATREEMQNLKMAMIGDPRKLQSSFRSDFGFLGDIGRLPANLDELLVKPGSLPAFTFDSSKQAGAGWKGPYITGAAAGEAQEDFKKDQWGNLYVYSDADFTNAQGQPADGKLTSPAPDRVVGTGDDIVLEILRNETTATVRGKVKDTAGVGLEAVPVEIYYPVNGTLTTVTATTDANGEYTFTSVPFGPRAVRALPRLVLAPGTVTTGGGGKDISFKVINYSQSADTITAIRADFTGGANYDQIQINDVTVDNTNNIVSGQVASTTDCPGGNPNCNVIAASPATRPPVRVVVDSPDTQLPDTAISGQGTTATMELNNFNQDMRGVPFTVRFNPGGVESIVKFTP